MGSHRFEASRLVVGEATNAFGVLLEAPRQAIFGRRYAAFPPITEVRDQDGAWDAVGQSRTLVLGDGGSLHQTLTSIDRPHSYAYLLDDICGRLRPFVRTIDGVWTVTPEGAGCRISWAWTLHPTAPPARLTTSVIGKMWQGYAERALKSVEAILTA